MVRALLMVPMLLAGCFGFGHCDYTPTDAHWQDPALWDAVDAPITAAQGMEIGHDHVALASIRVDGGQPGGHHHHRGHFVYYNDGALQASIEGDDHERLAGAARWLLANATQDLDVEAHVQSFLDSRTASEMEVHGERNGTWTRIEFYDYHHPVAIDPMLLLENLAVEPVSRGATEGPFELIFDAAQKEFTLDRLNMEVDFFGTAGAGRDWPELTTDEEILAEIQAALEGAGLPAPDDVEVQGYVC